MGKASRRKREQRELRERITAALDEANPFTEPTPSGLITGLPDIRAEILAGLWRTSPLGWWAESAPRFPPPAMGYVVRRPA